MPAENSRLAITRSFHLRRYVQIPVFFRHALSYAKLHSDCIRRLEDDFLVGMAGRKLMFNLQPS